MNVAGGRGCQCGDLPVFVSALRPNSVVARNGRIQVSEAERLCPLYGIYVYSQK